MPITSTWSMDGDPSFYDKKIRIFDLDIKKEITPLIKDNSFYHDSLEKYYDMADKKLQNILVSGNDVSLIMKDTKIEYCDLQSSPQIAPINVTVSPNSRVTIQIPITGGGNPEWYGQENMPGFFEIGPYDGIITGTPTTSAQFTIMAANACGLNYTTFTLNLSGA
jgi:hypothetical protein